MPPHCIGHQNKLLLLLALGSESMGWCPGGTCHMPPHCIGHRKKPILLLVARERINGTAPVARLRVLHEETHARVHRTARTAAENRLRLAAAKKACKKAVKKFRISQGRTQ